MVNSHLLGQFLLQNVIVFGSDLFHPLGAHSVCDHLHLLQGEDGLVLLAGRGAAGGAGHGHVVHIHHRLRGARGRARGRGAAVRRRPGGAGARARDPVSCKLSPPLQSLDLVPQVVGDLLGGQRSLSEHGGRRPRLLGGAVGTAHGAPALPPALLRPGGRMQGVKIQTSLESHASHHDAECSGAGFVKII